MTTASIEIRFDLAILEAEKLNGRLRLCGLVIMIPFLNQNHAESASKAAKYR